MSKAVLSLGYPRLPHFYHTWAGDYEIPVGILPIVRRDTTGAPYHRLQEGTWSLRSRLREVIDESRRAAEANRGIFPTSVPQSLPTRLPAILTHRCRISSYPGTRMTPQYSKSPLRQKTGVKLCLCLLNPGKHRLPKCLLRMPASQCFKRAIVRPLWQVLLHCLSRMKIARLRA